MYQVTFQFENGDKPVVFSASPNITLLEAARSANVAIDAPCSGNGSCGKCRVKILSGEVESYPSSHISEEEYAAGWRLSCASKVIGDVTVEVPDLTRTQAFHGLCLQQSKVALGNVGCALKRHLPLTRLQAVRKNRLLRPALSAPCAAH